MKLTAKRIKRIKKKVSNMAKSDILLFDLLYNKAVDAWMTFNYKLNITKWDNNNMAWARVNYILKVTLKDYRKIKKGRNKIIKDLKRFNECEYNLTCAEIYNDIESRYFINERVNKFDTLDYKLTTLIYDGYCDSDISKILNINRKTIYRRKLSIIERLIK